MAIYQCSQCERLLDVDYYPPEIDPRDPREIDLLCEWCAEELLDEDGKMVEVERNEKDSDGI